MKFQSNLALIASLISLSKALDQTEEGDIAIEVFGSDLQEHPYEYASYFSEHPLPSAIFTYIDTTGPYYEGSYAAFDYSAFSTYLTALPWYSTRLAPEISSAIASESEYQAAIPTETDYTESVYFTDSDFFNESGSTESESTLDDDSTSSTRSTGSTGTSSRSGSGSTSATGSGSTGSGSGSTGSGSTGSTGSSTSSSASVTSSPSSEASSGSSSGSSSSSSAASASSAGAGSLNQPGFGIWFITPFVFSLTAPMFLL